MNNGFVDQETAAPGPTPMSRAERRVERLLLAIVGLSVALMLVGILLAVIGGQSLARDALAFGELLEGLSHGESQAYLSLGLIGLIATPFARVVGSLVVFALSRERRFVLVTAAVLAVMAVSVVIGMSR